MTNIYLSPSTQDWNQYAGKTGSEEFYMNLLADALEPYLRSSGISFTRNRPDMTAGSCIRQANAGEYDFYLALHSNASSPREEGKNRGIIVFYYPGSPEGKRGAELIARELRQIYPLPDKVVTRPTTTLGEVARSRAPAALAEIGYHDNYADARWLEGHWDAIAQQLARAMTSFFGLPFIPPMKPVVGTVDVEQGGLNLRAAPSFQAPVRDVLPDGSEVTVLGEWQGWYVIRAGEQSGYAAAAYIDLP